MNAAERRAAAMVWWSALQPEAPGGGNRATLAQLRRCSTLAEAMQHPATIALFRKLGFSHPENLPRVALLAAVLAHVRKHDDAQRHFARAIGPQDSDDGSAVVSELRFRRLLQAENGDDQLTAFRRTVALAGARANVLDLADSLLAWNLPEHGDATRRNWIFRYWNAGESIA